MNSIQEPFQDIEDNYLSEGSSYETLTTRAFSQFYFMDSNDGGHYRLLVHSNKICLITLAPSHPIIRENLEITSIDYQVNDSCNRLDNKVIGKKKSGAQFLQCCSILCTINCKDRSQPFKVRSNLIAKLIEMNPKIVEDPNLLKDYDKGYIAIVFPKLSEHEREIKRWMPEPEYLDKLQQE